jgi:hypothetical protein
MHRTLTPAAILSAAIASAALCIGAGAAFAADTPIDSAVKTFKSVATDPAKMKIYCEMSDFMDKTGDNEDDATDAKVDDYAKQLGPEFQSAWNLGDDVDENSSDGKRLDAALDELSDKCHS